MRINAEKYREITERRNITNEEVCKKTGLSEKTLAWILENRFLEASTLDRIADAIRVEANVIAKEDILSNRENNIEFLKDEKTATVTFCQGRYVSRVKYLAEHYPDECRVTAENPDGSIVAMLPVKWIKFRPPMKLSDEERENRRMRLEERKSKG